MWVRRALQRAEPGAPLGSKGAIRGRLVTCWFSLGLIQLSRAKDGEGDNSFIFLPIILNNFTLFFFISILIARSYLFLNLSKCLISTWTVIDLRIIWKGSKFRISIFSTIEYSTIMTCFIILNFKFQILLSCPKNTTHISKMHYSLMIYLEIYLCLYFYPICSSSMETFCTIPDMFLDILGYLR